VRTKGRRGHAALRGRLPRLRDVREHAARRDRSTSENAGAGGPRSSRGLRRWEILNIMTEPLQARIATALERVINPRTGDNVIASEMIRDVGVTVEGRVRFSILLAAQDPASLVREVRQAVEGVEGVSDVRVDVKDPSQGAAPSATSASPASVNEGAPSPASHAAAHAAPHSAPHGHAHAAGGSGGAPGRSRSL